MPNYVNEEDLSVAVGRSVRSLQKDRWTGNGIFPYYKVGRSVMYDLDECLAIVRTLRVCPQTSKPVLE